MPSEPDIVARLEKASMAWARGSVLACPLTLPDLKQASDEITTLRARLAEVTKERDTARRTTDAYREAILRDTPWTDPVEAITRLHLDARVLAAEVRAWRRMSYMPTGVMQCDPDCGCPRCSAVRSFHAATRATDASGALERHGKKENTNG